MDGESLIHNLTLGLSNKEEFAIFVFNNIDQNIQLDIILELPLFLQYVKEQTPEICLAAINEDEKAKQFVKIDL